MTRQRVGLNDTSPGAERAQIELFRRASPARRLGLCIELSDEALELAWRALREAEPTASENELRARFVAVHYGRDLAARLSRFLSDPRR